MYNSKSLSDPRRRQAQVDRQGNGVVFWDLLGTLDLPSAVRSQDLERIGHTGIMVLRLSAWSPCRYRLCLGAPRTSKRVPTHFLHPMNTLLFTLRRTRGAIGSYQRPPGALHTAPYVPPTLRRTARDGSRISRIRKGVKVATIKVFARFQ